MARWDNIRDVLDLLDKLVSPAIAYGAWVLRDIRNSIRLLGERLDLTDKRADLQDKRQDEAESKKKRGK